MAHSSARAGYPQRIVCLTEETAEFICALGAGDLVVGVSQYAKRPKEIQTKPKVSSFIKANIDSIVDLRPDLVLTFSDIQAQITCDLAKKGIPVFNSNQRSIAEILSTLRQTGALIGWIEEAEKLCSEYEKNLERIREEASQLKSRPRIYFEEWPDPIITGIRWVSELIEIAGGEDIFPEHRDKSLAMERVVTPELIAQRDPEIILASWCGKKVNFEKMKTREHFEKITAIKNNNLHEIDSLIILQPGPACLTDGINAIQEIIN